MAIKYGTANADKIYGTSGGDKLYGRAGDDGVYGNDGNDYLYGEDGVDALFGGNGLDYLYGGKGGDYLSGGNDNDTLWGFEDNDTLRGDAGNDFLDGGSGNDNLDGGTGNDTLVHAVSGVVATGNDIFNGGAGTDTLLVKAGAATINGGGGNVKASVGIYIDPTGSSGELAFHDGIATTFVDAGRFSGIEKFAISQDTSLTFRGGHLDATVTGGEGKDAFVSGEGSETFIGGGGADVFEFNYGTGGTDKLIGFDADEDVILNTLWEDSQGNAISNRSITETNGHTIVKTTTFEGDLMHVLDIDAVGLPSDAFQSSYHWS